MTEYRIITERFSLIKMKMIRHYTFCAILIAICALLTVSALANQTLRIVDYVLESDIRAFIDGYEIPSYNISNRLGIVAEDLRGYGFDVVWNAEERSLRITQNGKGVTSPVAETDTKLKKSSIPVYSTNIVTYVNGEVVDSYNIGGYTIIYLRELERFGSCLYDHSCAASMVSTTYQSFKKSTIDTLPKTIIHACGEIGGVVGSNSLEALNATYEKGYRFIEIDFVLSSDGVPVCLHDWSKYYSLQLTDKPVTKAQFEKVILFGKYTSMTLDSLAEWMKEHDDAYIITDIKEDNLNVLRRIARKHPEIIGNIIPQIYQYDEYVPVRALGYSNIILTLYRLPTYFDKANAEYNSTFAANHGLLAVTADATLANSNFVNSFVSKGIPLYVHTVNDEAAQQKFFSMGVTGVYTDYAKDKRVNTEIEVTTEVSTEITATETTTAEVATEVSTFVATTTADPLADPLADPEAQATLFDPDTVIEPWETETVCETDLSDPDAIIP